MKPNEIIQKLINAIRADKFNWKRYTSRKQYGNSGYEIQTEVLHASYGQIGYSIYIYDERGSHLHTIDFDWEMGKITVDDRPVKEYNDSIKQEEFIDKLAKLLGEYNATITCTEITVDDKVLPCYHAANEPDDAYVLDSEASWWNNE